MASRACFRAGHAPEKSWQSKSLYPIYLT